MRMTVTAATMRVTARFGLRVIVRVGVLLAFSIPVRAVVMLVIMIVVMPIGVSLGVLLDDSRIARRLAAGQACSFRWRRNRAALAMGALGTRMMMRDRGNGPGVAALLTGGRESHRERIPCVPCRRRSPITEFLSRLDDGCSGDSRVSVQ